MHTVSNQTSHQMLPQQGLVLLGDGLQYAEQKDGSLYHPLWFFSLRLYQSKGVAQRCLQWQEQYGVDVNLLLACIWLFHHQVRLSQKEFEALASLASDWQRHQVAPIRKKRQALTQKIRWVWWQPDVYCQRREYLRQELQQEQREQAMIWHWVCHHRCLTRLEYEPSNTKIIVQFSHFYGMSAEATEQTFVDSLNKLY